MPVITISRGTLSGAELLAESVAAELQIPCVSREIIVHAAEAAGISEEALAEQMDRPPSFFSRHSRERDVYLWHVRSTLLQHAQNGSFVWTEEARQNVADVGLATRVTAELASGGELYSGDLELSAHANVVTVGGRVRTRKALDDVRAATEKAIGDAEYCCEVAVASEDHSWGFEHAEV